MSSLLAYDRIALALVTGYLRHTRFELGRWRLVPFAVAGMRRIGPRLGRRTVNTRYGFRMDLDLRDRFGQHVYATGEYEDSTSRVIAALLSPRDIVVDVGANVGYFTLLAASRVGAQGKVHAFEPIPSNQGEIRRNIELNGLSNVDVHPEALSDRDGDAPLHAGPAGHSGLSSLRTQPDCSVSAQVAHWLG